MQCAIEVSTSLIVQSKQGHIISLSGRECNINECLIIFLDFISLKKFGRGVFTSIILLLIPLRVAPYVLRLVMRQGFVLAILGIAIGLGGAYFLTALMKSLLYEVSATDAATYAWCGILFLIVALVASYFPARRAARCDPSEALRCE